MPTELDNELTDILFKAAGGISDLGTEEIKAIKEAIEKHVIPNKYSFKVPVQDFYSEKTKRPLKALEAYSGKFEHNQLVDTMRQSLWGDRS